MEIDWTELRCAARAAAARAYAPYSRLRVGAAGLADGGRVVIGCNVENASFGLTLCAECGLVSALHASAPGDGAAAPGAGAQDDERSAVGRLVAVAVVAGDGEPLLPCGRCRQLLLEAGGPGLLVDTKAGPRRLAELLPAAFTGGDLADRREAGPRRDVPGREAPVEAGPRRDVPDREAPVEAGPRRDLRGREAPREAGPRPGALRGGTDRA